MPSPTFYQWLSLVAIIWLQAFNGTNSDFSAYSSQLKSLLSISQVQLNNLAFASDAGKLFGWFSGIALAHLPLWLVLIIGSILGLIGYGVQFLYLTGKIASLPYWQIFLLCALAGNSICWINTVCYVATIKNFPSDQKIAVGVSTSYFGLSAKIYTSIVDVFFRGSATKKAQGYLLLNAAVPVGVSLVTTPLLREVKIEKPTSIKIGFVVMFFITVATGIFAVIDSVFSNQSVVAHAAGLGGLLAAPLVFPAVILVKDCLEGKCHIKREMRVYNFSMDEARIGDAAEVERKSEDGAEEGGGEAVNEDIGVKKMVKTMEFWLYFFIYLFGATLGLVFLNNLGQIAESRGLSKASRLVSLSSSFGFFGRLLPSILDYFLSKTTYRVSSTASIVAFMAPMAASFFLLLSTSNLSLFIGTAIIGVCTGAITSVAVSTTTELFGTKNFSLNHNIIVANIPFGSFLFGYLAALLYQREGKGGNGGCMGFECYKKTFILWGWICSVGTVLSFILYVRTRKKYSGRS